MSLPEYRLHTLGSNLRELARLAAEGSLILDAPYQRGVVWNHEQRINLLKSLIMGIPIPAIVLNRRGSNSAWKNNEGDPGEVWYAVIDGKQRITTSMMWFGSQFSIPANWLKAEFISPYHPSSEIYYEEITLPGKRFMGTNFTIPVAEAALDSLGKEAEIYGLINCAGTAQTEEDLARAREIAAPSQK